MAAQIPLRKAIATTRVTAAVISTISIGLFITVLTYIFGWSGSRYPGLSVLPAVALGISILWNAIALVSINSMARGFHAIVDLVVFSLLLALGLVGFLYDEYNYLRNGYHLSVSSLWLPQELAAGGCMVASASLQLLLVLLNFLSVRKAKSMQKEGFFIPPPPPPPYTEPIIAKLPKAELQEEKEGWFEEIDGKSLMSTSTMTESEKGSRTAEV